MEREIFVTEILNSANSLTKVVPSEALLKKIELKIQSEKYVSNATIWLVAASILILISFNIFFILNKNSDGTNSNLITLTQQNNQLYN